MRKNVVFLVMQLNELRENTFKENYSKSSLENSLLNSRINEGGIENEKLKEHVKDFEALPIFEPQTGGIWRK